MTPANVLVLEWDAIPAGLKAIDELEELEDARRNEKIASPVRKRGITSNEMCTFLIINIFSLQLIPVGVTVRKCKSGGSGGSGNCGYGGEYGGDSDIL